MRLTALLSVLLLAAPAVAADRPNLLFILIDDLGPEWLSCYGGAHSTPNIDRLARGGIRFTNVYAAPLCSPTRHMMLTGRYPFRTGWTEHHDTPRSGEPSFDPRREIAFPRLLRQAGYATAIAGKWQINSLKVQPDVLKKHGFDEHCVWPGVEAENPPSRERYENPYLQINGQRRIHTGKFGPDVFAEFLIDFMERHKDRPFLAYYPMVLTHMPFTRTPRTKDATLEGPALFPGMVDYVDGQVQQLVEALERLGLRERTVIILTTDNGTPRPIVGQVGTRRVRGGKGTLTEAGIRVPLIVNGPGRVPPDRVSETLVDFSDFFPTLLELAGAMPPKDVTIDGRSFAGELLGHPDGPRRREWIFSQLGKNRVISDGHYKLYNDGRFFDVKTDPKESHDLGKPEDGPAARSYERLKQALDALPEDARLPVLPRRDRAAE